MLNIYYPYSYFPVLVCMCKLSIKKKKKKKKIGLVNAGKRPAEDRRNALYMRAQQNSAAARLTMHFGVAAGLTAVTGLACFLYKNTNMFTFSGLRSGLLL